jgi:hypothetical protein
VRTRRRAITSPFRRNPVNGKSVDDVRRAILVDSTGTTGGRLAFLNHVTIMCGADSRTVMVAMMVNRVKMIRHILSITIAANFQSFVIFVFSSSLFN